MPNTQFTENSEWIEAVRKNFQKDPEANYISFTMNDDPVIKLYFSDDDQKEQLLQYLTTYDVADIGTLINLQTWTEARGMRVEVKVMRRFSVANWMLRFFLFLIQKFPQARDVVYPQRNW
jgi:hypothetical protein